MQHMSVRLEVVKFLSMTNTTKQKSLVISWHKGAEHCRPVQLLQQLIPCCSSWADKLLKPLHTSTGA